MSKTQPSSRSGEGRFKHLVSLIAAVLSFIAAVAAAYFAYQAAQVQTNPRFVEMALEFLRSPPDGNDRAALDEWSREVISEYSGVRLSEEAARSIASVFGPHGELTCGREPQVITLSEGVPVRAPQACVERAEVVFLDSGEEGAARLTLSLRGQAEPATLLADPGNLPSVRFEEARLEVSVTRLMPERKVVVLRITRLPPGVTSRGGERRRE